MRRCGGVSGRAVRAVRAGLQVEEELGDGRALSGVAIGRHAQQLVITPAQQLAADQGADGTDHEQLEQRQRREGGVQRALVQQCRVVQGEGGQRGGKQACLEQQRRECREA